MKILALYVIYKPDIETLLRSIKSIETIAESIFISDNSNENKSGLFQKDNIIYTNNKGNKGIAYAQNKGLTFALNNKYDFVFFLDQDSIANKDLLCSLLSDFIFLKKNGYNIGGIAPITINKDSGIELNKSSYIQKSIIKEKKFIQCRELMCSGSLIPVECFRSVGLMETELFIDYVDFEWSWRASSKMNFTFYISESLHMQHQLGYGDQKVLGKMIHMPSSFRIYYQFRNYLVLIRRNYVPFKWKLNEGLKCLTKYFAYPLFLSHGRKFLIRINKGIIDSFKYRKNN